MKEYKIIPLDKKTVGEINDEIANLKENGWHRSLDIFVVMEREIPEPVAETNLCPHCKEPTLLKTPEGIYCANCLKSI